LKAEIILRIILFLFSTNINCYFQFLTNFLSIVIYAKVAKIVLSSGEASNTNEI